MNCREVFSVYFNRDKLLELLRKCKFFCNPMVNYPNISAEYPKIIDKLLFACYYPFQESFLLILGGIEMLNDKIKSIIKTFVIGYIDKGTDDAVSFYIDDLSDTGFGNITIEQGCSYWGAKKGYRGTLDRAVGSSFFEPETKII